MDLYDFTLSVESTMKWKQQKVGIYKLLFYKYLKKVIEQR
jgi:hypothetical protein